MHLTLTSVVFELILEAIIFMNLLHLTLTSVVFESDTLFLN